MAYCTTKTFNYEYLHLGAFTEKPLVNHWNVMQSMYAPIITLTHATSQDVNCRQNKPWFSTI